MIFLQGVFSNVPLNHLPELMHSRIGCTCAIFLQSAFSIVPSNPQLMHSHIGYIWTSFLQRGSSYVSSNDLPVLMHSHIDCICSIVLQSVLLYVYSKDLNEQTQVYIGHICLVCLPFFSHITVSLSHNSRRLIVIYWECFIVAFRTLS